jgi:hypothetical protein
MEAAVVERDSEGPSSGDSKEPGVGAPGSSLWPFVFYFCSSAAVYILGGGQGKHPPSLVPRSTEGRGAEEVGTSPPPSLSPSPFLPFPIQGLCIIVSE